MRRGLALLSALGLALALAGCGQGSERPPEATAAPGYYAAGEAALESGDYAAAVDAFSLAIETGDQRAAAYAGRGDCYLALAGAEQTGPAPDLKGLALRDHELALELDPTLGERIYEVYQALAAKALDEDAPAEALCCLRLAMTAAPGEAERLSEQARPLTDGVLTGSVWYMDAPDSRYYEFFADGTGRIVDAAAMEEAGAFSYENEGFAVEVTAEGQTVRWTYDPDRESYYTAASTLDGEDLPMRLVSVSSRRMYARWQQTILGAEAELRLALTGEEEEDPSAGYGALYEREYALLEALAVTRAGTLTGEDEAALEAERERRALLQTDPSTAREAFGRLCRTVDGLTARLPDMAAGGSALGEIFPVGEQTLLDYLRLIADWALNERGQSAQSGGTPPDRWRALEDVDHYFQHGRLYLRLHGYTSFQGKTADELVPDESGVFAFATPLTYGDNVTAADEALLSRLREDSWIGLWDVGDGSGPLCLALRLEDDMTCTALGGPYPGEPTGRQSGGYALEGNELTLTLSADGYLPGTYRYRVLPMGDSLYMTLLTDGVIYGQSAGSACVFCSGGYAGDMGIADGWRSGDEAE